MYSLDSWTCWTWPWFSMLWRLSESLDKELNGLTRHLISVKFPPRCTKDGCASVCTGDFLNFSHHLRTRICLPSSSHLKGYVPSWILRWFRLISYHLNVFNIALSLAYFVLPGSRRSIFVAASIRFLFCSDQKPEIEAIGKADFATCLSINTSIGPVKLIRSHVPMVVNQHWPPCSPTSYTSSSRASGAFGYPLLIDAISLHLCSTMEHEKADVKVVPEFPSPSAGWSVPFWPCSAPSPLGSLYAGLSPLKSKPRKITYRFRSPGDKSKNLCYTWNHFGYQLREPLFCSEGFGTSIQLVTFSYVWFICHAGQECLCSWTEKYLIACNATVIFVVIPHVAPFK